VCNFDDSLFSVPHTLFPWIYLPKAKQKESRFPFSPEKNKSPRFETPRRKNLKGKHKA
jgi:hypothetical protein